MIEGIACTGGQSLSVLNDHIIGVQVGTFAVVKQHAAIICKAASGNQAVKGNQHIHIFQCAAVVSEGQEGTLTLDNSIDKGNILQSTLEHLAEEATVPIVGSGLRGHIVDHIALTVKGTGEGGGIGVFIRNASHINIAYQHKTAGRIACHHSGESSQLGGCAHGVGANCQGQIHRQLAAFTFQLYIDSHGFTLSKAQAAAAQSQDAVCKGAGHCSAAYGGRSQCAADVIIGQIHYDVAGILCAHIISICNGQLVGIDGAVFVGRANEALGNGESVLYSPEVAFPACYIHIESCTLCIAAISCGGAGQGGNADLVCADHIQAVKL